MGHELTEKKHYKSCKISVTDLLEIIKEAEGVVKDNVDADRPYIRTRFTIGLKGDKEVETEDYSEFKKLFYDYGADELIKVNVDLSNSNDRFNLSFSYAYTSDIGALEIRSSSRSHAFSDVMERIDRKIKPTKNYLVRNMFPVIATAIVFTLLVALNVAVLAKTHSSISKADAYLIFWLVAATAQLLYYFIAEKILAPLYLSTVIIGNTDYSNKGRVLESDMKRFGVWLIVLILGATILNIIGLG